MSTDELAGQLVRGGLDKGKAATAIKNWQHGQFKPAVRSADVERLADALGVGVRDLSEWRSSCKYAPISARKARLVTQLIAGKGVQEAIDTLKFTRKRAAEMVSKVLKCAIADADEQEADVESLYVSEARVDDAGIRLGTKRWIPKDRGRAHPIRKTASHIHITVTEE
ncbi:MAG: 50S ribosomal protein L22 [Planctomycetota bacterium]